MSKTRQMQRKYGHINVYSQYVEVGHGLCRLAHVNCTIILISDVCMVESIWNMVERKIYACTVVHFWLQ